MCVCVCGQAPWKVRREQVQLVGMAALMIASKMEDVHVPPPEKFLERADARVYSVGEYLFSLGRRIVCVWMMTVSQFWNLARRCPA